MAQGAEMVKTEVRVAGLELTMLMLVQAISVVTSQAHRRSPSHRQRHLQWALERWGMLKMPSEANPRDEYRL